MAEKLKKIRINIQYISLSDLLGKHPLNSKYQYFLITMILFNPH